MANGMYQLFQTLLDILSKRQYLTSFTTGWKPRVSKGVRVFLVKGSYKYDQQKKHGHYESCLFIRARYKGNWYKVSPDLQPIGHPISYITTSKWSIVQEVM